MKHFNTVLGQMLDILPRHKFQAIVARHGGDRYVKTFSCWSQFVCMLYAQLALCRSLRHVERDLRAKRGQAYHLHLARCSRNTLAHANQTRDCAMYEALFLALLERCTAKAPKHGFRFKNPLFSLDASTIDLCLSLFPWAEFRKAKGGVKIHVKLDHRGHVPSFLLVTTAKTSDIKGARKIRFEPGGLVVFDRGYNDYGWWSELDANRSFFVTRQKKNADYKVVKKRRVRRGSSVTSDWEIVLAGQSGKKYPQRLRRVRCINPEDGKAYVFITNIFHLSAETIADIYKSRWQIELFFKEIKQNLKIKKFLGTSENAVHTQIWIALIAYLLTAYLKFATRCALSVGRALDLIRSNLFDRRSIANLLLGCDEPPDFFKSRELQLELAFL